MPLSREAAPSSPTRTFGHAVLDLEEELGVVTPEMRAVIDDLEREAQSKVGKLTEPTSRTVEAALATFHRILTERGFVVAPDGYVDRLSDALTPVLLSGTELEALRRSFYNQGERARWLAAHAVADSVAVYVGDCDTLSFLYLSMADAVGLPLALVERPGGDGVVGHNWVQWSSGSERVAWETLQGTVYPDGRAPLSRPEAFGYVRRLVGLEWERRGIHARAARQYQLAVEGFPVAAALNNYAWVLATSSDPSVRNPDVAKKMAQAAIEKGCNADRLDTAAAAYAAAGDFAEAVVLEQAASRLEKDPTERAVFEHRTELYARGVPYVRARPTRDRRISDCIYAVDKLRTGQDPTQLRRGCLGLDDSMHSASWGKLEAAILSRPPQVLPASGFAIPKGCPRPPETPMLRGP
ncbi:MAG: hypothetical protein QM765_29670 [Myxococcales bacterium]